MIKYLSSRVRQVMRKMTIQQWVTLTADIDDDQQIWKIVNLEAKQCTPNIIWWMTVLLL